MSLTAIPAPPNDGPTDEGYIRGAGARQVSRLLVVRAAFALCIATLLALAIVLAVQAGAENSRRGRLQANGAPVRVTMTSCVGLASGTGITVAGYACRGTFTLYGRRYEESINGITRRYDPGTVVAGVVDPGDPGNVVAASGSAGATPSWHAYLPGMIVAGGLVVLVVAAICRRARPAGVQADAGAT